VYAFVEYMAARFPHHTITIFLRHDPATGTASWEAKMMMPVGADHVGRLFGGGAAAAAAGGGGAQASRPFVAKRSRPEFPPQAPAPAATARADAVRPVPHPGKRVRKKKTKRARKEGDKRRRSPSSRKGSRARAELFRLAQKAKRGAAVPPPPPLPAPTPPAPRPDCQGDLAAPSVTAAAREQRPTSTHGAAAELTLGAAGATLLDEEGSGCDYLEDNSSDADMGDD
jgi:hypothetical protein